MKKFVFAVSAFLLAVSFCACDQHTKPPESFSKDLKRIAFVSPQTSNPVWNQAKIGFFDAARDFGFYGMWLGSEKCNTNDMVRELKISLYEDVDGVVTCPLTPSEFTDVFRTLKEQKIPLVTIGIDAEDPQLRAAHVGSDYRAVGMEQAKALHEQAGDHMRIGVIMSGLSTQNQLVQVEMLKSYIAALPDAKIVAYDEDFADPVIGTHIISKMIRSHPEINAVFVTSGDAVSSYGKYLRENNLQDTITLIGIDIIQKNLDAVRNGDIYGVMSQDFYKMGYLAGEYAFKSALQEEIPAITYTDSQLITKENVDSVKVVVEKES